MPVSRSSTTRPVRAGPGSSWQATPAASNFPPPLDIHMISSLTAHTEDHRRWTPDHRDRHAPGRQTPMPESAAHIGYDADRADLPTL